MLSNKGPHPPESLAASLVSHMVRCRTCREQAHETDYLSARMSSDTDDDLCGR